MSNITYIAKRLAGMDYKAMLGKINVIHEKTGKGRLAILLDMWDCAKKYSAGYMDYWLYEMYNLTDEQRETYITRGRNDAIVRKYNDPAYTEIMDNKTKFNDIFKDYIKRDWIKLDADKVDVIKFIRNHSIFMAKPIDGTCGKGIDKIITDNFESPETVYEYLLKMSGDNLFELEELVIQDPRVSAIYPHAINTVRVVTILKDKKDPHVVCAYFRIGNKGHHVDNFNSEGMVAPVDEKTGTVLQPAIDKTKQLYDVHPETGTPIKGFQFPDWDNAMEMIKSAALVVPEVGYVGWDLAFSTKGPLLMEGNPYPGHDIYQLPEHTPDKIGIMPKFDI